MKFPLNSTDETLHSAVDRWIELLAQDDYSTAINLIESDEKSKWTPETLKNRVQNYADHEPHYSGQLFKVTSIDTTIPIKVGKHYRELNYLDEPVFRESSNAEIIAVIWHDLPLNNEWSDLTAEFFVLKRENYLTLILNELRVM